MEEYNVVLNKLHDYMFDENNMEKSLLMKFDFNKNSKDFNEKNTNTNTNTNKKENIIIPKEKDTLFWCYYIIKNGDIKYESLYNKNDLIAKQIKIDLVNLIRNNKDIVKMYKLDTISNLESNLANDHLLNMQTFLTLCAIGNINIIYISKKTYFELLLNDTDITYIIYEISTQNNYYKKYGYKTSDNELIETIKSSHYKIDKIDKPLRAITYYKVEDLINICNKLAIEIVNKNTGKNKSKKELYELIIQYF